MNSRCDEGYAKSREKRKKVQTNNLQNQRKQRMTKVLSHPEVQRTLPIVYSPDHFSRSGFLANPRSKFSEVTIKD